MINLRNTAWLDKLFASIGRNRRRWRHVPLKEQLALNRGKALGLPRKTPRTRYQERILADGYRRSAVRDGCPF